MSIRFGRATVSDLAIAETREWLVTNGIGGYASGTIAGSLARGYHGLLVAATNPPGGRRVVLVKLDESLVYGGTTYALGCNRWRDGTIAPRGHELIESFELERTIPRWRYACADAYLDKRVWMEDGANTTYVAYTLVSASAPVSLSVRAIVDNRPFHNTGELHVPTEVRIDGARAIVEWDPWSPSLILGISSGRLEAAQEIYRDYRLPAETGRGLRDFEDHVHAVTLSIDLTVGETVVVVASTERDAVPNLDALERRRAHETALLDRWSTRRAGWSGDSSGADDSSWAAQLVLAADQFVVSRPAADEPGGKSIIAGYHWFDDWGRDTMIALPGLVLSTGRPEIARPILQTFARYMSEGMLPNTFPDGGGTAEYNTIDATLWYFQAIADYYEATADLELVRSLFPVLRTIVDAHVAGTRYGIRVDASDGLLRGGVPGVQLTWMDAKVGDDVITPRIGKPVEVNALWYNALAVTARLATAVGEASEPYTALAARAREGFRRFWNAERGYCYDVLDGPDGHETNLRPNQLFAVSLPESPLSADQQKAVVDACARALLTSRGLRSLAPDASGYTGSYGGDRVARDGAYHQGTVWAWLIGPFVTAHFRVYHDKDAVLRVLTPFADSLAEGGLGTLGEIFDGDPPFTGKGCIAQAWSVAEVLRSLDRLVYA